ncbi:hypothetical protein G6L15_06955 [Agrobacterium rhizogenes]|uniref:hypothetical protein n=1 Tax=Rhizobium rhizogenes TaxID=359 RepID=UPI001573C14B|nr:hypothetical protein [Rhizobium rhizogenes]NTG85886.1 hypothetical protein [Rhizobium rhizogenes]
MTRHHSISGGAGSWLATKVDMAAHPREDHHFIFADTLYEDADCYRFLIEGLAHLLGRAVIVPSVDDFPDYRVSGDFDIATYAGNQEWREFLAYLRRQTEASIPELTWIVEGRDPWEVFRDSKFLGNSRIDPCSKSLKRAPLDKWRLENANAETDVFTVGIGPHEAHRYHRLAERMAKDGWRYEAPLLGTFEGEVGAFGYLKAAGIARPRLYRKNYMHNNCGGFCIKAGHAHYQNRYRVDPERYAYDAMMERKLAAYIGKPVTMMTDRANDNIKKPLSLDAFADRLASNPEFNFEYEQGTGGCGCMVDYEEAA